MISQTPKMAKARTHFAIFRGVNSGYRQNSNASSSFSSHLQPPPLLPPPPTILLPSTTIRTLLHNLKHLPSLDLLPNHLLTIKSHVLSWHKSISEYLIECQRLMISTFRIPMNRTAHRDKAFEIQELHEAAWRASQAGAWVESELETRFGWKMGGGGGGGEQGGETLKEIQALLQQVLNGVTNLMYAWSTTTERVDQARYKKT